MTPPKHLVAKLVASLMLVAAFSALMQGVFDPEWARPFVPWQARDGVMTPFLVMVASLCCLLLAFEERRPRWVDHAALLGEAIVVIVPGLVLLQHLFGLDLGLDLVRPDAAAAYGASHPARMSPNACIAMVCWGIALALLRRGIGGKHPARLWAIAAWTGAAMAISVAALAGHMLHLEALYKVADLNHMLPSTAAALSVLSALLWLLRDRIFEEARRSTDKHGVLIATRSVAILTLVALSSGIAGFAVLRGTLEKSVTDSTLLSATTNATSLANTLDLALWVPRTIADRPTVQESLLKLARDPSDAPARQALLKAADNLVATGVDGVRFEGAEGGLITSAGTLLGRNATSAHPLAVAQVGAQLLWQDGYVLAAVREVRVADQLVGRVVTEQRLPVFDTLLNAIRASNDSADALVCSLDGGDALCAPSRFYPQPFKIQTFNAAGELNLPANRAVAGQTGVTLVKDLRGVEVVAAYAPVARYGLGFVVKSDVQTLFEPVRAQIRMLGILLVLLVTAGTAALLVRVRPLLQQVMHEQRRTRVILENSNDAFISMDVHGKITDWNAAAERTFGWPRDQAIGKDMASLLIPASQRAAHSAGFQHFLRTGQGPVVNHRLEVMALRAGGHEIPVELAVAVLKDRSGYSANAFARDISERRAAEAKLALSEQRLRDITDNVPAMISVFDRNERLTFVNPQCAAVYRMPSAEMLGKTVLDVRGAQDHVQLQPYIDRVLAGEQVGFESTTVLNGKVHSFQQNYVPQRHADGTVQGFYSVSFDVTERRQSEERARRSEKRLRDITDNMPALISYIDSEQHLTFLNATFRDWLGVEPASILGRTLLDVIGPTLYAERRPFLEQALAGQRVAFEVESQALGVQRSLQAEYIPDLAPDGTVMGIYTISTDVSRLKSVERQLGVLARNDPLTGLANRYAFNEKLAEALARAQRTQDALALLFLDVDRFKAINDQFGHATGDAVLKEVAARLVSAVRATDTVARLAGDEFVVVLEFLRNAAEAQPVVQKVLAQLVQPFSVEGLSLQVTTSIGVSVHTHGPVAAEDLLARADKALYRAKEAGRNRYCIED